MENRYSSAQNRTVKPYNRKKKSNCYDIQINSTKTTYGRIIVLLNDRAGSGTHSYHCLIKHFFRHICPRLKVINHIGISTQSVSLLQDMWTSLSCNISLNILRRMRRLAGRVASTHSTEEIINDFGGKWLVWRDSCMRKAELIFCTFWVGFDIWKCLSSVPVQQESSCAVSNYTLFCTEK